MTYPLRILVVHNCEDVSNGRKSTLDFVFGFERYAPQHEFFYHRIMHPLPPVIREEDWDAIIFDPTALGAATLRPRELFHRIRESWDFARRHRAVKIVFPQDDASHGGLLDFWFQWMEVDAVFTVRPEKKDLIYPLTSRRAEFVSTVSGFIDDRSIESCRALGIPFEERAVVYPAWGGRFARRKGLAAARMKEECERRKIRHDIATDPSDTIMGDDWFAFLGQCRFVVGAEGGHGLWDPYGVIKDAVVDYTDRHPDASFEEIEDMCFKGLDGVETFPGFAPRVLEAALMECGQILVEGDYRGFIRPGEHYIPLKEDFSNLEEVFTAIENTDRVRSMIAAARRDLVDGPRFRYSTFVAGTIEYVERRCLEKRRTLATTRTDTSALTNRYWNELREALESLARAEGFVEPHLTEWVRNQLSTQVVDSVVRARLQLDAGGPSPSQDLAPPPQADRDNADPPCPPTAMQAVTEASSDDPVASSNKDWVSRLTRRARRITRQMLGGTGF
jgi:hypothetical protein